MTSQELKQYINDKLGNSVRCLLPSYWWKRLFGLVVDKIDDAIPNVTSEEKLNSLDSKIGSLATVSYKKNVVSSPSQCYQVTEAEFWSVAVNGTAHGIDLTTIYGVEFPSVIPSIETDIIFIFFKDGALVKGSIYVSTENVFYLDDTGTYALYNDSGFLINESVEYINTSFKDGVQYGFCMTNIDGSEVLYSDYDTIDKFVNFTIEVSASDAYVKNQDGWDKLVKETEETEETEIPTIFYSSIGAMTGVSIRKVDCTYDLWESTKEKLINASVSTDVIDKVQATFYESIAANQKLFLDLKTGKKSSGLAYVNDNNLAYKLFSELDPSFMGGIDFCLQSVASVTCFRADDQCEVYFTTMLTNVQGDSLLNAISKQNYVFQLMETGEVKVLYDILPYFYRTVTNGTHSKHNIAFVNSWYEAQSADTDIVGQLPFERIYMNGYSGIRMLSTDFTSKKFTGTFLEGLELKQVEISGETGETTITTLGTFATVTE